MIAPIPEPNGKKTLFAYLDEYLSEREISTGGAKQLRYSLTNFSKWLGYPATTDDLNKQALNGWILHLTDKAKLAAHSIKNRRVNVMTL